MSDSNSATSSGISLSSLIFIIFLVLKLTGTGIVATWSWWWVTSPLWIGAAIILGIGGVGLIIFGIISAVDWILGKLRSNN